MKPLLSVFIPTYNRAALLDSALAALAPQIKQHHPQVELIVADNASTDHTPQVIARWQAEMPMMVTVRNAQNLGFYGNLFRITRELARGVFAWMVGDDDIVRPDGVERVLAVLQEQRQTVDYVFVNTTMLKQVERQKHPEPVSGDLFDLQPVKCTHLESYQVDDWQQFIDPQYDEVFLGAAILSVFRLSLWQEALQKLNPPPEQNTAINYFNTIIMAHAYKGRPAYYLGYPCTVSFRGAQDWATSLAAIPLTLLQDLLDGYLAAGIDPARVETCRRSLLSMSVEPLQIVMQKSGIPFQDQFRLPHFLWRNRRQGKYLWEFIGKVLEPGLPIGRDALRDYPLLPGQILTDNLPPVTAIIYGEGDVQATIDSLSTYPNLQIIVIGRDAATRNEAMQQTKEGYIAFVQAGAISHPQRLHIQASFLHHYPDVWLCYSAYQQGDETIRTHEFAGSAYFMLLKHGVDIHTSTVMLRSDSGGFDETLGSMAEADLWLRVARNHEIAMTTTPLVRVPAGETDAPFDKTYTLLLWNKIFGNDPYPVGAHSRAPLHNRAGLRPAPTAAVGTQSFSLPPKSGEGPGIGVKQPIGWRFKRKTRSRYYFEAVRELYTHWPDVPLSTGQVWRCLLATMWYAPGKITNPHVVGLLVRLAFPQTLYKRLRPLWKSVLRGRS